MNKLKKIAIILAAVTSVAASGQMHAQGFTPQDVASTSNCVIPKVDGERVPFPLRAANTKFELSENQTYLLNGTLVQINSQVLFQVDFTTQPWLATEKLMQFPYFPVDSLTAKDVLRYKGQLIQLAVFAQKNDIKGSSDEAASANMKLNLILTPASL